jgi:hypothetical protein
MFMHVSSEKSMKFMNMIPFPEGVQASVCGKVKQPEVGPAWLGVSAQ